MQVEILILAAGKSSRMNGKNKLLEWVGTSTILEHVIVESVNSLATKVSVILPSKESQLWSIALNYPVHKLLACPSQIGMGYSISRGMININGRQPDGVIIVLADMPEIKSAHLDNMIEALTRNPTKGIVRATSIKGRHGNPVLFQKKFFDHLINLKNDQGGQRIIADNREYVQYIQLPGDAALIDLDTPEQWRNWKKGL